MKKFNENIHTKSKRKNFMAIHYFKTKKIGQFLGLKVSEKNILGLTLNPVISSIHKMVKNINKKIET